MIQKDNFFIITGGPGVGKTSLLEELQQKGFPYVKEVARKIIKEQIEMQGDALPWENQQKYSDLMLKRSVQDFTEFSNETKVLFFDRGIPDTFGYQRLINLPVSSAFKKILKEYRYNSNVFILPPWLEIYHTDNERKQDFEEAQKTFEVMCEAYTEIGYNLIKVPKTNIPERANFILKHI